VRAVATWPSELTDVEFLSVRSSSPRRVGGTGAGRWVSVKSPKDLLFDAARVIVIKTKMDVNYNNIIIIINVCAYDTDSNDIDRRRMLRRLSNGDHDDVEPYLREVIIL